MWEGEGRKMSGRKVLGWAAQGGFNENYRGAEIELKLLKKVRMEIAINEEFLKVTIDAIIKGAKTGNIGDGKIFVLDLAECIRIRTGELGKEAVG